MQNLLIKRIASIIHFEWSDFRAENLRAFLVLVKIKSCHKFCVGGSNVSISLFMQDIAQVSVFFYNHYGNSPYETGPGKVSGGNIKCFSVTPWPTLSFPALSKFRFVLQIPTYSGLTYSLTQNLGMEWHRPCRFRSVLKVGRPKLICPQTQLWRQLSLLTNPMNWC